ncbi:MAG: 3-deoxy-D-manno-octulosonic acid transferase [Desulfobacteraceae bacterium]|nr:3-deoxy-D-manno-octulosonic acid transferase [Desulfobacteraceae bacterium]
MNQYGFLKIALKFYDLGWQLLIPVLRISSRLRQSFEARKLLVPLPGAGLWIQAASGGEAYLACSLIRKLSPARPLRILVTTNTRQGMDILEKARADICAGSSGITLLLGWCPFDRPEIMKKAVGQVNPGLVVLLETEIWPGLLYALKIRKRPAWIINGRITPKSLFFYQICRRLLQKVRPEKILAVSEEDSARFAGLFGKDIVSMMPNMKFDSLPTEKDGDQKSALAELIDSKAKFIILGSVRRQEENKVKNIIKHVHSHYPDAIIGLFPRHMHRINHWKHELAAMEGSWQLRSKLGSAAKTGTIILWDKFGELSHAYQRADAVFVGGSLAPLGGQNFLEPVVQGCRPVIGPYWENFLWVGKEIFSRGLVLRENNWQAAARQLLNQLENTAEKENMRTKANRYIAARRGGTKKACHMIEEYLMHQGRQRRSYGQSRIA